MASQAKAARKLSPDENEDSSDDNGEPQAKVMKPLDRNEMMMKQISIKVSESLNDAKFMELFQTNWEDGSNFTSSLCGTTLYNDPFRFCTIQNFLADSDITKNLVNEMLNVNWTRKIMDLYEFYQSTDLVNISSSYLAAFFVMLKTVVMPWMENLCNIKLSSVSASCSMYNCGDYLLVHDDLLSDRQIAFVYYLSPWENMKTWTNEMGGCLELFSADSNGLPHFPVVRKISPRNNQFVFFKVGSRSFHQVGEVTTFDYPRLTINGWFHGENNNVISTNRLSVPRIFVPPFSKNVSLSDWITASYLKESNKKNIQNGVEDRSEVCLYCFFLQPVYESIAKELITNENLRWTLKGPANAQCYEILELDSTEGLLKDFVELFSSKEMFKLFYEYTELDFHGPNAKDPVCSLELQRWHHGSYTILGTDTTSEGNILDVILFLNTTEDVGEFTYVELEEMESNNESETYADSVLLTVPPKPNALNIIYHFEGHSRFTKYVSKKRKMTNGYVYILVCSYKE